MAAEHDGELPPTQRLIRTAVLRQLPDIDVLYLFGSHAQGQAQQDSDLDLAVLPIAPLSSLARFHAQRELGVRLDRDVDLIDLHTANSVLRLEIIRHGRLLYHRDDSRTLDFEARVLSEYAEWMDATRDLRQAIYQRGILRL